MAEALATTTLALSFMDNAVVAAGAATVAGAAGVDPNHHCIRMNSNFIEYKEITCLYPNLDPFYFK